MRILSEIDPGSGLRLRFFALKVLVLIPISVAFAVSRNYPVAETAGFFCAWNAIFAGLAALFQGQRYNALSLTAWDEMAAFVAIACLMRAVQAIAA